MHNYESFTTFLHRTAVSFWAYMILLSILLTTAITIFYVGNTVYQQIAHPHILNFK